MFSKPWAWRGVTAAHHPQDLGVAPVAPEHQRVVAGLSATLSAAFKGFTKDGKPEGQDFPAASVTHPTLISRP